MTAMLTGAVVLARYTFFSAIVFKAKPYTLLSGRTSIKFPGPRTRYEVSSPEPERIVDFDD